MTDNFTVIEGEKARVASIKEGTSGIFQIKRTQMQPPDGMLLPSQLDPAAMMIRGPSRNMSMGGTP